LLQHIAHEAVDDEGKTLENFAIFISEFDVEIRDYVHICLSIGTGFTNFVVLGARVEAI
jgi:hypothetical protein